MDFNTHVRRSTVTTVKKSDKKTFSKQQKSQKVMFSKYGRGKKLWEKWYFVTKIVLTYCENCSRDGEKLLKFEAEGWEFAKLLRSLEQFIQTV